MALIFLSAPGGAATRLEQCIAAAADDWLPQETWGWERLCNNEVIDLGLFAGSNEPFDPHSAPANPWPDTRVLRPEFLRDILLFEPYRQLIAGTPVQVRGAWLREEFRLEGVALENQLTFADSRIDARIYISNGRTDYRFGIFSSRVTAPFRFRFMQCQEVLLLDSVFDDAVDIYGLNSDQSIVLEESHFEGHVNLSASRADSLNIGRPGFEPTWGPNARLSLRLTRVNNIEDSVASWDKLAGRLDLLGFRYDAFSGWAASWREVSQQISGGAAERSTEWLIGWLANQVSREEIYMPQPYEQLAAVLENAGQGQKADAVLYAKHEYWRLHKTTGVGDYLWLTVKKYVIGYGYQIWLTVAWLLVLVATGALVLMRSNQGRRLGLAECLLYSIDQSLPLIYMNPANERIAEAHSLALKYYFQVHQLASLALLAFLGAGLAGAIG